MWPKMLFELLPHFARLLPMADKYLTTRSVSEKAQEAALAALAADVRGELGKATEAQAGLQQQMQEQGTQIAEIAVDVARVRLAVDSVEARIGKLERSLGLALRLLWVALLLLTVVFTILVVRKH